MNEVITTELETTASEDGIYIGDPTWVEDEDIFGEDLAEIALDMYEEALENPEYDLDDEEGEYESLITVDSARHEFNLNVADIEDLILDETDVLDDFSLDAEVEIQFRVRTANGTVTGPLSGVTVIVR